MFKVRSICLIWVSLVLWLFFGLEAFAATADGMTSSAKSQATTHDASPLSMSYENGLLSAKISGASLRDVAQHLADTTGAKVELLGSKKGVEVPVWGTVSKKPLEAALPLILKNISYSSKPVPGSKQLKITIYAVERAGSDTSASITSNTTAKSTDGASVAGAGTDIRQTQVADTRSPSSQKSLRSEGAASKTAPPEPDLAAPTASSMTEEPAIEPSPHAEAPLDAPRDLDELMPLPQQPSINTALDGEGAQSGNSASVDIRTLAKLERSTRAVNSEYSHIRAMALDELVSTKDARATPVIAGAAMKQGMSSEDRLQAAESLWRHAADLEFSNPAAVRSLQELARDRDAAVAAVAKRALADMDLYHKRQR